MPRYEFLRTHYAERVEHKVQLESPVTEVDYLGERTLVKTASGECFVADRVIVTVPIGVLKAGAIAFVPPLSEQRKAAIAAVPFLRGFKLFLKFSDKFYPDLAALS